MMNHKSRIPSNTDTSDSEESCKSITNSEDGDLSIVAEFDELMRLRVSQNDDVVEKFVEFIGQVQLLNDAYKKSLLENKRLQGELEKKIMDISDLERRLTTARKLVDQEKKHMHKIQKEREEMEAKLARVASILLSSNQNYLPKETRQQLELLNLSTTYTNTVPLFETTKPHFETIPEVNSTGSLLSDFSYSLSEDGLDTSRVARGKHWNVHRPSLEGLEQPAAKKRCSGSFKSVEIDTNDKVRATTTLTLNKGGPITATSVIEAIPPGTPKSHKIIPSAPPQHLLNNVWQKGSPSAINDFGHKPHNFQSKTIIVPDYCVVCKKRIGFAKSAYKCKNCLILCHLECKDNFDEPCNPSALALNGLISDYTPTTPPMIPSLIINCVREIEARGFNTIGLYRVPGAEKEVQMLKEKLLKGKTAPQLKDVDVYVLCGTVKNFLRSLHEPIVNHTRWARCVAVVNTESGKPDEEGLKQIVKELPQPNRDTLAFLVLHLKRIAIQPECKMPIKNLAAVFGLTIIGCGSNVVDVDPSTHFTDTKLQIAVMESLLNLPEDFWASLLENNNFKKTPSTDSLLSPLPRYVISPHKNLFSAKKSRKVFDNVGDI